MDSNESRKLPPSSSNFPSLTQAPGRVCGACAASAFNSKYDLLASATVGNVNSRPAMRRKFKAGDRVIWNSEAGHVSGTIIKVHTEDINYKGYTYHASAGHIAMHKGHALKTRFNRRCFAGMRAVMLPVLSPTPQAAEIGNCCYRKLFVMMQNVTMTLCAAGSPPSIAAP